MTRPTHFPNLLAKLGEEARGSQEETKRRPRRWTWDPTLHRDWEGRHCDLFQAAHQLLRRRRLEQLLVVVVPTRVKMAPCSEPPSDPKAANEMYTLSVESLRRFLQHRHKSLGYYRDAVGLRVGSVCVGL